MKLLIVNILLQITTSFYVSDRHEYFKNWIIKFVLGQL